MLWIALIAKHSSWSDAVVYRKHLLYLASWWVCDVTGFLDLFVWSYMSVWDQAYDVNQMISIMWLDWTLECACLQRLLCKWRRMCIKVHMHLPLQLQECSQQWYGTEIKCKFYKNSEGVLSRDGGCNPQACSGANLDFSGRNITEISPGTFSGLSWHIV